MAHFRTAASIAVAILMTLGSVRAQKPANPSVEELLVKADEYVQGYASKVSGVTLEEQFLLIELAGTEMRVPVRITSDVVFLRINVDGKIIGLRDPFAVDSRPVRERQPRIMKVLAEPTQANWQLAQNFSRENAILFSSNAVLWYSDPALALQFIRDSNQSRLTFKLEGNKKMNGVTVFGLGFKERQEPGKTYLLNTPSNPYASGRFWIDPATGAIHMTELWVQSDTDTARVQVSYAPDKTLGILLPKEASHTFEMREAGTGGNVGPRGSKWAHDCSAKYTNPRYTALDLSRIAR